ncbi:Hypothetical protein AA314_05122 [Archangium gephyra]|uniref:Uncharacterized protein n=1 Tax=Archangium gephyra TaxID=48 RepID=A0AAC8TGG2_9BACT|nr:Hypothetical protein AA314_05122 [Archangium gephyra]
MRSRGRIRDTDADPPRSRGARAPTDEVDRRDTSPRALCRILHPGPLGGVRGRWILPADADARRAPHGRGVDVELAYIRREGRRLLDGGRGLLAGTTSRGEERSPHHEEERQEGREGSALQEKLAVQGGIVQP